MIVCSSAEVADATRAAAEQVERLDGLECIAENNGFIEQFCRAIKGDAKPKLIVMDCLAHPIPVLELLQIVRGIEGGMNENRTPVLVLGSKEQESDLKASLNELGNARFVRRGQDTSAAGQGPRIIGLVEKILNRGK